MSKLAHKRYKTCPMAPPETLVQALEGAASADPSRGFRFVSDAGVPGFGDSKDVGVSEASFSFAAIERASARYGGALQALGLAKGDRVALILPSNEDFILCFFGAMRAGIVPVPIYPPLGLGQLQGYLDNTRHVVAKSGAKALVTTAQIKRLLGTVQEACPSLDAVVAVEAIRESHEPLRAQTIRPSDLAFLQFTSGSTSRPKGVALTHDNLIANTRNIHTAGLRCDDHDVGISWLPLYHDMGLIGMVLAPLELKIPVVFLPPLLFLKRPVTWLQAITRHKGTISFGPNFAYALATKRVRERELEGLDLASWRVAGCGAEPIRPETLEAFADTFAKVGFDRRALLPAYGMAESTLAVCFTKLGEGMKTRSVDADVLFAEGRATPAREGDDKALRLVSCGAAFEGHAIGVFAESDAESASPLPDGQVGEVRLRGPSVMTSYWEDSEKTREAFAGGWLKTGDMGLLDAGELYICGRSKELIIVNGRNYYPQDIEWEASKVAGVRKGNVIAFGAQGTSGDRERVVVAFEVQDATVSPEQWKAHGQSLGLKVQKAVQEGLGLTLDDVVPLQPGALPKTSSGKLQRRKARELYETNELTARKSARDGDRLALAKQAAKSQLSYFKLAVFGGRGKPGKPSE